MRIACVLLAALGCGSCISTSLAQAPERVVLVELFTSEGCSSCPPADALLRMLDGKRESGALVVGLSEHVTYWNSLGWADPFSQEAFTARQDGYGARFGLDSVYTPQMVIDGKTQVLGSDRAAVAKAIDALPAARAASVHIDSVATSAKGLAVTFTVGGAFQGNADVYAVIADDMARSSVSRGENSGRTLDHVSVARSFTRVATVKDGKTITVSLAMPAVVKGQPETKRHLVLFAQESGLGEVLAIDSRGL